ncbi:MAG: glycosyl hydrolase [Clostridiaceae bacterium]
MNLKSKKNILLIIPIISILLFSSCNNQANEYEIKDDKVLLIMGQDLGAVGGLKDYDDGYVDYIGVPGGVTTYTSLDTLEGLETFTNYGSGDVCGQYYLEDETFDDAYIAIGLSLVGDLDNIVAGDRDENINELGKWIKNTNRTVFLRIGYEYEGSWNDYDFIKYKKAYIRIVDILRKNNIKNFKTVWQSSGYSEDSMDYLLNWYPGDDYVDWVGFSYFDQIANTGAKSTLEIAKTKNKPVMIAESAPKLDNLVGDGESIWNKWYKPYFAFIEKHKDQIKAVAYINVRWDDQAMWKGQGWGDSRIQANEYIREKWLEKMKSGLFETGELAKDNKKFTPPEDIDELKEEAKPFSAEGAIEAENFQATGNVKVYNDGAASNQNGMAYIMEDGDGIYLEDAPKASKVIIRYASMESGKLGIYINDEKKTDFKFIATGNWIGTGNYNEITVDIDVPENSKFEIRFEGKESNEKAANIDCIKFN